VHDKLLDFFFNKKAITCMCMCLDILEIDLVPQLEKLQLLFIFQHYGMPPH